MATLESLDAKINNLVEKLDAKFEVIDNKFDVLGKKIDGKIDDLAAMTARGFAELRGEFKTDMHEVRDRLGIIEENYVTKDDLAASDKRTEIMLDKHLGIFRKDYDDLAKRTKNLEKVVFAH